MWYTIARHTTEASVLLAMRATVGDEAAAEVLFENSEMSDKELLEFTERHSNQVSSLVEAKLENDERNT